jgi:hypothetical protein
MERKMKHAEFDSIQKEIAIFFSLAHRVIAFSHVINEFAMALGTSNL